MKLSEEALGKLNEIDVDSVWVHEISGEVMESMKSYDGALLEYKKSVELAPTQAGTHYLLANAYWSLRLWDQASQEFRPELANDPGNCAAEWKIGNTTLEQRQDPAEALASVARALAKCPHLDGSPRRPWPCFDAVGSQRRSRKRIANRGKSRSRRTRNTLPSRASPTRRRSLAKSAAQMQIFSDL
jgi:tetratricopeptide (TPR) repeat protein